MSKLFEMHKIEYTLFPGLVKPHINAPEITPTNIGVEFWKPIKLTATKRISEDNTYSINRGINELIYQHIAKVHTAIVPPRLRIFGGLDSDEWNFGKKGGRLSTRIIKWLMNHYRDMNDEIYKVMKSPEFKNDVGNFISRYDNDIEDNCHLVFAPGAVWKPGTFMEETTSCWWGSYKDSIGILYNAGGGAILVYDEDMNPIGRAWYAPIANEFIIFNAYGKYDIYDLGVMVSGYMKTSMTRIRFDNSVGMFINNNAGVLIGKLPIKYVEVDYERVSTPFWSPFTCKSCGDVYYPDDMPARLHSTNMCSACYRKSSIDVYGVNTERGLINEIIEFTVTMNGVEYTLMLTPNQVEGMISNTNNLRQELNRRNNIERSE